MNKYIDQAQKLIDEAVKSNNFHFKYSNHIFALGNRSDDYLVYIFDLATHELYIDFNDYCYRSFSIVDKSHGSLIEAGNDNHFVDS